MDDLISRETVRETLQMYIPGFKWDTIDKIVDMIPSAQPELIAQGAYVRGFEQGRTQGMLDAKLQPTCNHLATDCISRQAALRLITGYNGVMDKSVAKRLLTQISSAQPEQQWIPCEREMPEDYTDVLVWFEYFRYGDYNCLYQTHGIGSYSAEYDSWMINHETGWHKLRVMAWMPLPEPYKGES